MGAVARYLVAGLAMALVLALWRLDHVSTSLDTATERVGVLEAANASRKATQRLLIQLDTDNTKVLTDAQAQNKALLARVGAGAQRLSVPARCPVVRASPGPGRVDDAEARAELDPAAGQRIVAIAGDGDEAIIALNSLIDWVNTACLPRK
ncbi:lysis protein [Pseudomonas sp. MPR-R2A7]|nr:lysis protein [Pseudomonas sp. GW460-12]PMX36894.1 lysis protein [Pseudomonas sp. MPR-R2A4]PMX43290.1 lysis protein [Pseudomonas sp. MPR-R2A7]PMX53309.1 lysis protein [Pseudomonas sp. MPR-R2A6]PMX93415.1 lysis protein [Pseudomonas sp. MPR-R2A3]PMY12602.1 lysis protein [Pseudomonas sp. MPR-R2A5]PNA36397.1 lysis protein [Pseudomonas sp. MPR-ANB1]PNA50851.1 lysis protein [Pseudomonas sp. MPR-LB5]PNA74933.1 lysis protein [Pseudomonas sp. MPR-LB3]